MDEYLIAFFSSLCMGIYNTTPKVGAKGDIEMNFALLGDGSLLLFGLYCDFWWMNVDFG